jgi:uncharacterized protein
MLKQHNVCFHVIAVVTAEALDRAEEIFCFFQQLGLDEIGFNVEELEGIHGSSSLSDISNERIDRFWEQLHASCEAAGGRPVVREFQRAYRAILLCNVNASWEEVARYNDQVLPFRIVSVDWRGQLSTFSPELLGLTNVTYDHFVFGNVLSDDLSTVRSSPAFRAVANAVRDGVIACAKTCDYFAVCGGGAPSNKLAENGTFSSTETMHCRGSIQAPIRIALANLEAKTKSLN